MGAADARQSQRRRMRPPSPDMPPFMSGGSGGSSHFAPFGGSAAGGSSFFSFSSSSTSMSGNGVTYQSTTTSRVGPGGVRETQRVVRDGRTGQEEITISRGIGEKERTITRARDAAGQERRHDLLRGIDAAEADRFDAEWMRAAERNLGGFGAPGLALGGGGIGRQQRQQQQALPALPPSAPPPIYHAHGDSGPQRHHNMTYYPPGSRQV